MVRRNRKKRLPRPGAARRAGGARVLVYIAGGLLLGAVLGGGAYFGYRFLHTHPALSLRQIELQGAVHTSLQSVLRTTGLRQGMNLFEVDTQACSSQLESLPWVRRARVERLMPDRVMVELEEWQPAALVSAGGLYLADPEGHIFKRAAAEDGADLPIISGLDEKWLQQDAGEARRRISQALEQLDRLQRLPCLQEKKIAELYLDRLSGYAMVLDPGALMVQLDQQAVERPQLLCRALKSVSGLPVARLRLDRTARGWQVAAALAPGSSAREGINN